MLRSDGEKEPSLGRFDRDIDPAALFLLLFCFFARNAPDEIGGGKEEERQGGDEGGEEKMGARCEEEGEDERDRGTIVCSFNGNVVVV